MGYELLVCEMLLPSGYLQFPFVLSNLFHYVVYLAKFSLRCIFRGQK